MQPVLKGERHPAHLTEQVVVPSNPLPYSEDFPPQIQAWGRIDKRGKLGLVNTKRKVVNTKMKFQVLCISLWNGR